MLILAYIGPGAGFILSSSFFTLLATFAAGAVAVLAVPVRMVWRLLRRRSRARP